MRIALTAVFKEDFKVMLSESNINVSHIRDFTFSSDHIDKVKKIHVKLTYL